MDINNVRYLMVKKPFRRITPIGYSFPRLTILDNDYTIGDDKMVYQVVSQSDFMREYYPSGHKINSPVLYPDIERKNPDGGTVYEMVDRCSFAFQRVISVKQLVHLCGNSIQFELASDETSQKIKDTFFKFRAGWAAKNMEIAWYNSAKSAKITGDTAFVGFKSGKKFGWKVLSFLDGDTLFPHYNSITGELEILARLYSDYDGEGNVLKDWLEVWDNKKLYRYKRNSGANIIIKLIDKIFYVDGFQKVEELVHGFPFLPVSYYRSEDGPCWSNSQNTIENYEVSFSRMSQNNAAYAFPIMYFKGDDVEIHGSVTRGTVTSISMGKEDEAGFLNRQDVSTSFSTQLEKLYKLIFEQSFSVIPPELKSGDIPGVAVKLLYSPAYEQATVDAQEYKSFVDGMVKIFKEGYGTEIGEVSQFNNMNVYSWIKPYIHQNWTETITNLATAVQNGFLSRQRANEVADEYSTSYDWDRIMKEKKEEQQMEIIAEVNKQQQAIKTE